MMPQLPRPCCCIRHAGGQALHMAASSTHGAVQHTIKVSTCPRLSKPAHRQESSLPQMLPHCPTCCQAAHCHSHASLPHVLQAQPGRCARLAAQQRVTGPGSQCGGSGSSSHLQGVCQVAQQPKCSGRCVRVLWLRAAQNHRWQACQLAVEAAAGDWFGCGGVLSAALAAVVLMPGWPYGLMQGWQEWLDRSLLSSVAFAVCLQQCGRALLWSRLNAAALWHHSVELRGVWQQACQVCRAHVPLLMAHINGT
jgi:hypothetical protein